MQCSQAILHQPGSKCSESLHMVCQCQQDRSHNRGMQEEPDSPQALSLRMTDNTGRQFSQPGHPIQLEGTKLLHYASSHSQSHKAPRNFNREEDSQIGPAWEATIHEVKTLKGKPSSGSETAAVRPSPPFCNKPPYTYQHPLFSSSLPTSQPTLDYTKTPVPPTLSKTQQNVLHHVLSALGPLHRPE